MGFGGRDATAAYVPIHPSDALDKNIAPEKHLGDLDQASILELRQAKKNQTKTRDELRVEEALKNKPPLSRIINVQDMEVEHALLQTLALFDAGIPLGNSQETSSLQSPGLLCVCRRRLHKYVPVSAWSSMPLKQYEKRTRKMPVHLVAFSSTLES